MVQARGHRRGGQPRAPLRAPAPRIAATRVAPVASSASSKRSGITAGRMSSTPTASSSSTCGASSRCSSPYGSSASASPSSVPTGGPPSGSSIQPRSGSVAIGRSTRSGTTRTSTSYSPASNAVRGPVAFSHTRPPVVGAVITVPHGRTRGCSASPVRRSPAAASRSSIHATASLPPRRRGPDPDAVAHGKTARNTKAANSTRCTPPSWTVARPGSTVSAPTDDGDREQHHLRRAEAEHERAVEPDRRHRDRRDREPDARDRRAEREVEAGLHPAAGRVAIGRERLGQQHQQRDRDADRGRRRADRVDAVLDRGRLDLREADHRHQRDDEQPEADQRLARASAAPRAPPRRRPRRAGSSPGGAPSARRRTARRARSRPRRRTRAGRRRTPAPGSLVVKRGRTSVSVASVRDGGERGRRPLGVELRHPPVQRTDEHGHPEHPVAGDHRRREHGVARERRRVVALAGDHQRDDQPDLDHGHRDREHERAERLADAVRDDLGVMHGGQHRAGQEQADDDQHRRSRLAAPRRRQQERGEDRDDDGPRRAGGHRMRASM